MDGRVFYGIMAKFSKVKVTLKVPRNFMNISMINQKKTTPKHIIVKLREHKIKERTLKETRGKDGHKLYLISPQNQ